MYKFRKNLALLCTISLITCSTNQLVFATSTKKTQPQINSTAKALKKPTTPVKKTTTPAKKIPTPIKKPTSKITKYTIVVNNKKTNYTIEIKGNYLVIPTNIIKSTFGYDVKIDPKNSIININNNQTNTETNNTLIEQLKNDLKNKENEINEKTKTSDEYKSKYDKLTSENNELKTKIEQLEKKQDTTTQNSSDLIKNIDISDGITRFDKYVKVTLTPNNPEIYKIYFLGSDAKFQYNSKNNFFYGLVNSNSEETIKKNIVVVKK